MKTPVTFVLRIYVFWTAFESRQRKQTGRVWLLSVLELSFMSKESDC